MKFALTSLVVMLVAVVAQDEAEEAEEASPEFPGPHYTANGWTFGDAVEGLCATLQEIAAPGGEPAIGTLIPYVMDESVVQIFGGDQLYEGIGFKINQLEYDAEVIMLDATLMFVQFEECKGVFSFTCRIIPYTEEEKAKGLVDVPKYAPIGDNVMCEELFFRTMAIDFCDEEGPSYDAKRCGGHEEDRVSPEIETR